LCGALRSEGLKLLNWNESQQQWQARVLSLRKWNPAQSWPNVSDEVLLNTPEDWLSPYLINVSNRADFQKLDLDSIF